MKVRVSYNGIITAFQAEDASSILATRSKRINTMSDVLHYYLVAFNSEIDATDPCNPTAEVGVECFCYCGNECEYFEHLMGAEDRLPVDASQVLSRMKMIQRMNPQRHIRIYGVRTSFEEQDFRDLCQEMPQLTEQSIKENGVLL